MNKSPYLRDCHARGPEAELFIVEGKSAAAALNRARSRRHQAVFALQGKIPNPHKATTAKTLANDPVRCLFDVIGSGIGTQCKPADCQFGKILLLCDSDIDGRHSQSLLIGLCGIYLEPLIQSGRIGVITAPAYRLPVEAESECHRYLYSEAEKLRWFEQCRESAVPIEGLTHFKGIAAMGTDEIFKTLIDKNTRQETELTDFHKLEQRSGKQANDVE